MAETFVTLYQGNGGRVDIGYTLSQSIENNQTTITATAYAVKTNSSYYSYRSSPQNFTLTINGNAKVYGWTFNFGNMNLNQRYAITSHAVTINHNPDGSLGSISTSVYCATGTDGLGTVNGSTAIAIPTIPRASSISSISGGTLGLPVTVNISRASASFTHTVVYRRTDGVDVNVGSDQATSCVFTPSIDDSALLPNTTSGIATIFVHTYIGGTYVGTASQSFTVYVPSSVVPVINSVSKSEAVAGIATKFGGYVQNKSKLAINIGAVGAQESTITSWSTTILGILYSGASFTSGLLTSVGTVSVSTTVWDTRGRSTTTSSNVTVVVYNPPSITAFSGFRSTSGGVQDITNGTYLRTAMNFSVSPVNVGGVDKNSKSYKVEYKLQSSGTWLPLTSGAVFSYNSAFTSASGILSLNSAYDVRLTVADWFSSVTATFQVGTAFALMDWHSSGLSMAIGKVAEGNGILDLGGKLFVNGIEAINAEGNIALLDTRSVNTPTDIGDKGVMFAFKANTTDGLADGGTYHSVMTIQSWTDSSGGNIHELGFTVNGNLYIRTAPIGGAWGVWKLLWNSANFNPASYSLTSHGHTLLSLGADPSAVYGTNANGNYFKFGDGTLICTCNASPNHSVANGANYESGTYAFPYSFVGNIVTSLQGYVTDGGGSFLNVAIHPWWDGMWHYTLKNTSGVTLTRIVNLKMIAIGRWK